MEELAIATAKKWLSENIRHLDVEKDVQVISKIHKGSDDLVELFNPFGKGEIPLAHDTSFGAGYYPTTFLKDTIIKIEELLNDTSTKKKFPFIGEDIKIMGVKKQSQYYFMIAIAIIDKYITNLNDYVSKIEQLKEFVRTTLFLADATIHINTADDYARESIYLTVTGTSAENGDDGQVGRGNRINGLIAPYRPMSLEATSGKNPVSHIGKIYNYLAMDLSRAIVENKYTDAAHVFIVSQIGKPINEPQLLHFKLKNRVASKEQFEALAKEKLSGLHTYWRRIINVYTTIPKQGT